MSSSLAIERDNILKLFPDTFKQARKSRLKGQIIFFLIILYLIVFIFNSFSRLNFRDLQLI